MTDEEIEMWSEIAEDIQNTNDKDEIICICTMQVMMTAGCKCGAIEKERAREKKIKEELDKQRDKDLNNGMSYFDRLKKYGY